MKRGLSIKYWLLIANAFLILVPLFGLQFLRLWDRHLVRVTEESLIAESILLGEVWLRELRRELQVSESPTPADVPVDVTPVLVGNYTVLPAAPPPRLGHEIDAGPVARAAERTADLVRGRLAVEFVFLDARGCSVADLSEARGGCVDHWEEVATALTGRYAAHARARALPQSLRPSDIGRTGAVRVATALPVHHEGRVVGVVHAARRASGPLEVVLEHRRTVVAAVIVCVSLMLGVTWFLTWAISRPVRAVTTAARAVVRGEAPQMVPTPRLAPAELDVLADTVNRMTELLTDKAEYIAGFAATVSHELKSPITGIRGAVELLQDGSTMPEPQRRRFLANIDASARRMEMLVRRLLELARIQSAPELAEEIEVGTYFGELARSYGERVRVDTQRAPKSIVMSREHLDAAVRNLLENALRHGGDAPVEISIEARDGRMVVNVRDSGPGISAGNQARVFDRFFTTERDSGGTGLGLAIVQAVAETRGGSVDFETGSDGTVFRLVL